MWTSLPQRIDHNAQAFPRVAVEAKVNPYPLLLTVPTNVRPIDSATFAIGGKSYRLDGLDPIAPTQICVTRDGAKAACGRRSMLALRQDLVGKTLQCRQTGTAGEATVVECGATGLALAIRVARDGYAKATPKAAKEVTDAADEARRGLAGVWGAPRR